MCFSGNIRQIGAVLLVSASVLSISTAQAQEANSNTALTSSALSAAASALSFELELLNNPDILDWYAARDFEPIWNEAPAVLTLVSVLEDAASNGLPVIRYNTEALLALWSAADGTPERDAMFEAAATSVFVQYAVDVSTGIIEPSSL